jgi:hypothetical protein
MKAIKIYTDKAGNTLYKKYIKTRGIWQYSAKNKHGKLVTGKGVQILIKRAGMGKITGLKGRGKIKKGKYKR